VGADPKVPDRFVLAQAKNNLDQQPSSLAYRIVGAAGDVAQIEWLGPTSWTDADLLAVDSAEMRHLLRATRFLTTFLQAGPRTQHEVISAARAQGVGKRPLRRAARELKVRYPRGGFGHAHTTYWRLPDQKLPAHLRDSSTEELDAVLEALEAKYADGPPIADQAALFPPPLPPDTTAHEVTDGAA
jgi:hypothetical protein